MMWMTNVSVHIIGRVVEPVRRFHLFLFFGELDGSAFFIQFLMLKSNFNVLVENWLQRICPYICHYIKSIMRAKTWFRPYGENT